MVSMGREDTRYPPSALREVAVGIGVRDAYVAELLALDRGERARVGVLEVMIDDAVGSDRARASMRALGARWPLVAHGTELGIGQACGVDEAYIGEIARALGELHVRWYSEHLSFLRAGDVNLGHFAPVSSTPEARAALAANAAIVRAKSPCPLLLENPADVLGWEAERGGAALGASFAGSLVAAEAGALLDLTNLVLGARNDGYDARDWLDAMDLGRVVQVHLAGGRFDGALWIDSHDQEVDADALGLLDHVARAAPNLTAVIVERDERLPPLAEMLGEVDRIREVLRRAGRVV
jgi:uncharacterized protein (UPF0276 family)